MIQVKQNGSNSFCLQVSSTMEVDTSSFEIVGWRHGRISTKSCYVLESKEVHVWVMRQKDPWRDKWSQRIPDFKAGRESRAMFDAWLRSSLFFPIDPPPHQILFMLDRYLTWFGLSTVFLSTKKIYFRQPFFNLWLIKQYEFGLHFTKKTALLDSKSLKTARDMYHSWALLFPCKKPWSVLMKSPRPMYKRHVMGRERWK